MINKKCKIDYIKNIYQLDDSFNKKSLSLFKTKAFFKIFADSNCIGKNSGWSPIFSVIHEGNKQTNLILRKLADDDEDIKRHCDFVDRWFRWNVDTEIFARAMAGWENIMNDDDPYLPNLSDEEREKLAQTVKDLSQH